MIKGCRSRKILDKYVAVKKVMLVAPRDKFQILIKTYMTNM
jgi:hypothetical protein